MNEKLLTVLVLASLVLSIFNLVLLLRTNNGTEILGQSSGVTWKKVELNYTLMNDYAFPVYSVSIPNMPQYPDIPMWNATITLQWTNGTVQYFDVGSPYYSGGGTSAISEIVVLPLGLLYGHLGTTIIPRNSWNVTSITAYILEPPS